MQVAVEEARSDRARLKMNEVATLRESLKIRKVMMVNREPSTPRVDVE